MGRIFHVEKPGKRGRQFIAVGRGRSQHLSGVAVVIAPMAASEAGTADAVGCGDARQYREAGCDVQVLVAISLAQNELGDLEVRSRGLEPGTAII
jgi:hypothetical protein